MPVNFETQKQAAVKVNDYLGIQDGSRIISGLLRRFPDDVRGLAAGDMSILDKHTDLVAGADQVEKIKDDMLEIMPVNNTDVPQAVLDKIYSLLDEYSKKFNIPDYNKCSGLQWRAACQYIGFWMGRSKFIRNEEIEKKEGGKRFRGDNVAALVPVWASLCATYNHPPLHGDFIAFSGVSSGWFYECAGHDLTSTGLQILQKVRELERAGLDAAVADHKQNPVGRIFLLKAKHGYKEASEVIHTSRQERRDVDEIAASIGLSLESKENQ